MKSLNRILVIALVSLAGVLVSCVNREYTLTQDYTVTENKTENITESYTENETYMSISSGEFELPSFNSWGVSNFYYYGYDVPDWDLYDNISLRIVIPAPPQYEPESITVFDMSKPGHISYPEPPIVGEDTTTDETANYFITGTASHNWLKAANSALVQAKFLGAKTNLWSNGNDPQTIELDAGKASKIAIIISDPQYKWNTYLRLFVRWTASTPAYHPVTRERIVQNQVPYQVVRQRTYYQIKSVPIWETFFPAN